MNNVLQLLYPLINVIVTAIFAGVVLRQYLQRHRSYQLYWAIALLMAFVATLAYVLMIVAHPTSSVGIFFFRLYYIFGAALMPAWLGLGSMALVTSQKVTRILLVILSVLSLLAVVLIATAQIDMAHLAQIAGTPGTGTLQPGAWLATIIVLNTLGVLAVVGVAIYSGWQLLKRQGSSNLLWGNLLILAGDILNAAAGTMARGLGLASAFWLIMAIGWTVFFVGVLFASSKHRAAAPASPRTTNNFKQA